MRLLVTGARGLLGAAIIREFQRDAQVRAYDRAALDVSDETAVAAAIARDEPEIIVNCAAYNHVDLAEQQPLDALRVNAFGVLSLVRVAAQTGALLVHYSTDFVFDGQTNRPYREDDRPNPRGTYAASKLLGDWFALEAPRAYVLRVESLFGQPGEGSPRRGSLPTIIDRIRRGEEVPVFVDRTVSPSFTPDIARATRHLIDRGASPGLYHCVNDGAATWAEIAAESARLLDRPLHMKPMTLETAPLVAPRPRYCALDPSKLAAAGFPMPHWRDALARFLGRT